MQTFGEKTVGLSFNPSNNAQVHDAKKLAATFIDLCDKFRGISDSPDIKRLMSVAITEAETASMFAVKALTWEK